MKSQTTARERFMAFRAILIVISNSQRSRRLDMEKNLLPLIPSILVMLVLLAVWFLQPDYCAPTGCSEPSLFALPAFMILTLLVALAYRKNKVSEE